jgi:hypothetical protein
LWTGRAGVGFCFLFGGEDVGFWCSNVLAKAKIHDIMRIIDVSVPDSSTALALESTPQRHLLSAETIDDPPIFVGLRVAFASHLLQLDLLIKQWLYIHFH